jgi:hypothetical protein
MPITNRRSQEMPITNQRPGNADCSAAQDKSCATGCAQQCGGILRLVAGMTISGVVLKLLRKTLALAAGGAMLGLVCCGGKRFITTAQSAPAPFIPVKILSSSITPASGAIHLGDKVRATTRLDPPVSSSQPYLVFADLNYMEHHTSRFKLYDDGTHGDKKARDGDWTLELALRPDLAFEPRVMLGLVLIDTAGTMISYKLAGLDVKPAAKKHEAR